MLALVHWRQNPAHLVRGQMAVIIGEQQPGFLLVAHKAIDLLQEIPALHGNTHVGNGRKNLFVVLFGVVHLFYSIFFRDPAPAQWHRSRQRSRRPFPLKGR